MTARVPQPAYPAKDSAIIYGDKALYQRISEVAEQEEARELIEHFEIPIRTARAWVVKKGKFCSNFNFHLSMGMRLY